VNGTWSVAFTAPSSVSKETYNLYIDMSDQDYADGEVSQSTDTFIADRILVYWEQLNDSRTNVNSNIEWRIKAVLDFDETSLGSADTLTCAWGTLTWDSGNNWYNIIHTRTTVGSETIGTWSGNETNYKITSIAENITETPGIFDNIVVSGKGVTDARTNLNEYEQYFFTLRSEYDNTMVQSGTVTLNGSVSASWAASRNRWEYNTTKATSQKQTLYVASANWADYGITNLSDQASNASSIIWDQITVVSAGSVKGNLTVGSTGINYFTLKRDYDGTSVTSGTVTLDNGSSCTWNATSNRWEYSYTGSTEAAVKRYVKSVTDGNYGTTALNPTASTLYATISWKASGTDWTMTLLIGGALLAILALLIIIFLRKRAKGSKP
jgi:hypothetical protein